MCGELRAFLKGVHDDFTPSPCPKSEESQSKAKAESNNGRNGSNTLRSQEYKYISNLLLLNMAIEVLRRSRSDYIRSATLDGSSSFCLSWFPPEGIKVQPVNLNECYSDEDMFSSDSSSSDEDENCEINFYRQRLHQKASISYKSAGRVEDDVPCSNEWQGYRGAMDVLLPLGYTTEFVQSILQLAADLSSWDDVNLLESDNGRETTFAVRGATFARPQHFCLCWDSDQAESKLISQMTSLDLDSSDHGRNSYKLMDLKRRKHRHDKMRRIKMKEALPRMIQSTEVKNSVLQDPVYGIFDGKRQRCLQFLNAEKSRAVYLRTPRFDCGPVKGPITMFCVGIATEDGCFVSGLDTRFELGHLHGIDAMDKSIDMSPICICAESTSPTLPCDGLYGDNVRSYSEDISDSSCDDYQIKRKGSIFCQCQIQYRNANCGSLSEEMSLRPEPKQKNISRGTMGPGRWHCYTAVFNGQDSIIRVDGCTEQLRKSAAGNSKTDDTPFLDGLTIGSDHSFEMTLCFGEGSEGEGEGSIAELAVFKGELQIQDIECYENYLMKKHGIVHGQHQIFPQKENMLAGNIGNQWQEDLWRRQAHALITHPPNPDPTVDAGISIPLRVAAKHRSVAWHRCNEVTGNSVKVSRIGSRQSHGSSDW